MLHWQEQTVSDDRPGPDQVRERILIAHDGEGCEWIVSAHEDGTWNWTRSSGGEMLELGTDFETRERAKAAADKRAREVLR